MRSRLGRLVLRGTALAGLLSTCACASVIKGSGQKVAIQSTPPGAEVIVDGQPRGQTPTDIYFSHGKSYHVELRKPGYEPAQDTITSSFSGHSLWLTFYSVLFDAIAGNIMTIDQRRIALELRPAAVAATPAPVPSPGPAPVNTIVPVAAAEAPIPPGPELKVAVLELVNVAQLSDFEARAMADMVRGAALSLPTRRLFVLTRENILELLPPGTDLSTCVGECEVETGRNVGAHLVVSGQVGRFGTRLQVLLKMHDTRTGRLLASRTVSGATLDELEPLITEAGTHLFREALLRAGEGA